MSDIQKTMQSILNGNATQTSVELVAIAKVIQAAEILSQSGFDEESKLVLGTLETPELEKQASADDILFEVTLED